MRADLILHNATVLTLDPALPRAELVAVAAGRVLAVTENEALDELAGPACTVIDCGGRTVVPGFDDAHCHFMALAKSRVTIDVGPDVAHSIADIEGRISEGARDLPRNAWVRAGGYNEFYLAEKRHPTRWDLDRASPSHPVKLTHRSGHAHVLSSLALRLVGVGADSPDPPGGLIERDPKTGEPNGLIYDGGDFLSRRIPALGESDIERGVRLAASELLALGITSIQDASAENDFERWELFQRWRDQGDLRCRVSLLLGLEAFEQYCKKGMPPYLSDEGVHLGGVKIILHETTGRLVPTPDELERVVARIHQSQMQVALHAVEESTVVAACSVLERVVRRYPRADHRHRIEHCSVCRRETAERLASLGALVVTQPAFVYFNGERYLRTVPRDELAHLYPIATLLKAGVRVAAGSDCPVVAPNPLIGLYAAVSRRTESGEALLPSESVSPVEALRMYTETAAYVSREEAHKGRIVPGNYADLAVLSADPTGGPSGETRELQVDMTVLGGDVVWRRVWWE